MGEPQTYWNGEPCKARRVRVIVGDSGRFAAPWFREYVGQERAAVEVTYGRQTFYLDDEGGYGWAKVTEGRGGPCEPTARLRRHRRRRWLVDVYLPTGFGACWWPQFLALVIPRWFGRRSTE